MLKWVHAHTQIICFVLGTTTNKVPIAQIIVEQYGSKCTRFMSIDHIVVGKNGNGTNFLPLSLDKSGTSKGNHPIL